MIKKGVAAKKGTKKPAERKPRDLETVLVPAKKDIPTATSTSTAPLPSYFKHWANDRLLPLASSVSLVDKKQVESLGIVSVLDNEALAANPPPAISLDNLQESQESLSIPEFVSTHGIKERLTPLIQDLVAESMPKDVSDPEPAEPRSKKAKQLKRKLEPGVLPPITSTLFPLLNSYRDVQASSVHLIDKQAEDEVRLAYVLHSVNHVFKTRDRVLKNTARLNTIAAKEAELAKVKKAVEIKKKAGVVEPEEEQEPVEEEEEEVEDLEESEDDEDAGDVTKSGDSIEYRDQGFTRPKVLIILPFKNIAFDVINMILKLSGASQIENKSRFISEFSVPPEEDGTDASKPLDFQTDFRGNIDDMFRIGIKFSRRHLKLFSDFYSSDIIVTSPLGLRMVIGAEGDNDRDFDFLSSIEVVVADRCDILMMQNWDHLQHLFNHLNLTPKTARDCDFARIKSWYLDGRAAQLRQNIVLSHFAAPEINALMTKKGKNVDGKIKITSSYDGSIGQVVVQVPQMFTKFACTSLQTHDDSRFHHFTSKTLPQLLRSGGQTGSMILVPSYLDFVRVRNYLTSQNIEFGELCEYTPQPDVSRNRSNFFHGKIGLLVVTERFHFFRRYKIRGVKRVVWYQVPEYPQFYSEIVNGVEKGMDSGVQVLYSQYDWLRLERIVGSKRVGKMMEKETFLFA
ncbi:rRNA-binding ribosome biosynthesis protein utp25 [Podochytrium sp. JEL0797]|nr:rRNA-binding ribosome biosynthesis protein utp25 [Podochytrium sp. JEL0797]